MASDSNASPGVFISVSESGAATRSCSFYALSPKEVSVKRGLNQIMLVERTNNARTGF